MQDQFILEDGSKAISKVFCPPLSSSCRYKASISCCALSGSYGILENPDEAMQAENDMSNPKRLLKREDNGAFHNIARRIASMWLVNLDVKIGDVPRFCLEWRRDARDDRSRGSEGFRTVVNRRHGIRSGKKESIRVGQVTGSCCGHQSCYTQGQLS